MEGHDGYFSDDTGDDGWNYTTDASRHFRITETPAQKAIRLGVPLIHVDRWAPKPVQENPIIGICGACGLEIRYMMSYTCSKNGCPVFLSGA